MIHARLTLFSEELGMGTSVTVLHPQRARGQIGMGAKAAATPRVLYLLHGLTDDDTGWTRRTAIERHAAERDLLIVMPAVARSFYCDEVHGEKYFSYLADELPAIIGNLFGGLAHYSSGPAGVVYGSGYVKAAELVKIGFVMSIVNIVIWTLVGGAWMKLLGIW